MCDTKLWRLIDWTKHYLGIQTNKEFLFQLTFIFLFMLKNYFKSNYKISDFKIYFLQQAVLHVCGLVVLVSPVFVVLKLEEDIPDTTETTASTTAAHGDELLPS